MPKNLCNSKSPSSAKSAAVLSMAPGQVRERNNASFKAVPILLAMLAMALLLLPGISAAMTATFSPNFPISVDQNANVVIPYNVTVSGALRSTESYTIYSTYNTTNGCSGVIPDQNTSSTTIIRIFSLSSSGFIYCYNGTTKTGTVNFSFADSPYNISVEVQNVTNLPNATSQSIYNFSTNFSIDPKLTFKAMNVSPSSVYTSKALNFGISINPSGTLPFNYTVTTGTSSTSCQSDTTAVAKGSLGSSSYSVTIPVNANSTPRTYYYCASVKDSSYDSPQTVSSPNQPLSVNVVSPPTFSLSQPHTAYDVGQPMPLGFVIHNGIGPFTASFYSASNNTQIGSTQDIPTPDSSGSFTFNAPVTAGSYTYYIKGVDEETNNGGSGAAYDFQSQNAIYTISPALKAPTISISSNALDQGQPLEANVVVTGGTEPYSATVDVYSASSNALVYHNDVSAESTTGFSVPISSNALAPGTYYAKVSVSDSSGTPETNQSAASGNFLIVAAPQIFLSFSSNSLTYPSSPSVSVSAANGFAPYKFALNIYPNSGNIVYSASNTLLANSTSVSTHQLPTLAAGTYTANVVLTDSASPADTVNSSATFTVLKAAPQAYLTTSPSGSYTYNGTGIKVSYGFNSINPQISGSFAIDGNTVSAVPSQTSIASYSSGPLQGAAVSPDGNSIYFASIVSGMEKFDLSSNSLSTVGNFNSPSDVAFSANGMYGYATSYNLNTVSVFDVSNSVIIDTFNTITKPFSIALSANGTYAYVANVGPFISKIYTSNGVVAGRINNSNPSSAFYAVAVFGNTLYATNYDGGPNSIGSVDLFNTSTGLQYKNITGPGIISPTYIALGQNGRFLYVSESGGAIDSNITVINTTSYSVTGNIDIGSTAQGVVILPNSSIGYATTLNNTLVKFSTGEGYYNGPSLPSTYTFSLSIPSTQNYTSLSVSKSITVNKIAATLSLDVPNNFAYNGTNATVTASIYPANLIGKLYMAVNGPSFKLIASTSSTSNTITYNAPAAAGTYAFRFNTTGNATYSQTATMGTGPYTISKTFPTHHLSVVPSSFVYTGKPFNVNFSIGSFMNQVTGTLSLNGNKIATYVPNSINTVSANAINVGNYTLLLSTPFNGNYYSTITSETFVISAYAPHTVLNVPSSRAYNGTNAIITASISPANAIGNLYMSIDGGSSILVASTTAASNTLAYTAPASSGNYSFSFNNIANTLYAEALSTGSYNIYKAVPQLRFTQECGSYTFDGNTCNTIASISTIGNQITAGLYYNGTFEGSTSNTITYTGSNTINTYYVVFNTTGNANYTKDSISYAYSINTHHSGGSTTSTTTSTTTTASTTVTTSSTVTTTVPSQYINVSSGKRSFTGTFVISPSKPLDILFKSTDTLIKLVSNSTLNQSVNFTIANYTRNVPPLSGMRILKVLEINLTHANVTALITVPYACSYANPTSSVYMLVNGSWRPVSYVLNESSCTATFDVSSDPIIGVFQKAFASATTTIAPTTTITTTKQGTPPKPNFTSLIIIAAVIIVAIVVTILVLTLTKRGKTQKR